MNWLKLTVSIVVIAACVFALIFGYRMVQYFMMTGASALNELGNSDVPLDEQDPVPLETPPDPKSDAWLDSFGEDAYDSVQGADLTPEATDSLDEFSDDEDLSEVPVDELPEDLPPYTPEENP